MVAEAIPSEVCLNAAHSFFRQQDKRTVMLALLAAGVVVPVRYVLIVATVSSLI